MLSEKAEASCRMMYLRHVFSFKWLSTIQDSSSSLHIAKCGTVSSSAMMATSMKISGRFLPPSI